jgi:hypothetical protein
MRLQLLFSLGTHRERERERETRPPTFPCFDFPRCSLSVFFLRLSLSFKSGKVGGVTGWRRAARVICHPFFPLSSSSSSFRFLFVFFFFFFSLHFFFEELLNEFDSLWPSIYWTHTDGYEGRGELFFILFFPTSSFRLVFYFCLNNTEMKE